MRTRSRVRRIWLDLCYVGQFACITTNRVPVLGNTPCRPQSTRSPPETSAKGLGHRVNTIWAGPPVRHSGLLDHPLTRRLLGRDYDLGARKDANV